MSRTRTPLPALQAVLILAVAGATTASHASSESIEAGRRKANQACAVCHGALGIATAPDAPHLAGQSAVYTKAQLLAYRSGMRRHEVMQVIARQLTDDDIENLSTWYAAIRVEASPPPR